MNISSLFPQLQGQVSVEEAYETNLDKVLESRIVPELKKPKMSEITFSNGGFHCTMDKTSHSRSSPDQLSPCQSSHSQSSPEQSSPEQTSLNGMSPGSKSGADFYSELCNNHLESSVDIDDSFSCSSFEKNSVPEQFRIDDMVLTNFRMVDESGCGFFSYEQAYIDYYLSEISEKDSCVFKEDSSVEPRTGLGTGFQDELNGCVQEDELWDSNQVVQDFWSSTLDSKYKFLSRSVVAQSVERYYLRSQSGATLMT